MFKDENDFEKIVDRLKIDTEPNPKHRENLRRQVLSVFNQAEQKPATRILVFRTLRSTIMKSPVTKLAAAAIIIIAVLVGINLLVFDGTNSAYAAVIEQLHNAHTVTYRLVTSAANMEIEVAFKEPGYMRMTMPGGYVTVADWSQGKALSIIPPRQQFIEMNMSSLADDPARQQFDAIEKLRSLPDRADEILGSRQENGRVLQGFLVRENHIINTVWIDTDTKELVHVEIESINAPGMSAVMTDFQFDIDLNDSLFNLTPPAGYTRMDIQVNASEITEQDLIEYLRLWSTWTTDRSFPPTFNPIELQKVAMEMERQGRFGDDQTSEQDRRQHAMQMTRGMMFVTQLPAQSNWRYAGENVSFGDADKPIFWYKPQGSETYRVIYGDLSVKNVAPENLPQ